MTLYTLYIVVTFVALFLFSAIKILREYERGVVFLLGRFFLQTRKFLIFTKHPQYFIHIVGAIIVQCGCRFGLVE